MSKLREQYNNELRAKIKEQLGLTNIMAVPKVQKIVLNIGLGKATQEKSWVEYGSSILQRISGQKPVLTKAK
ncbi:MAG: large subunit ribosomal protein, partial [Patescibacteria group bacterium]|nr:large subunit ribosomal protein [Patescibacteria group bacterium]